jgi:hypothetical protein
MNTTSPAFLLERRPISAEINEGNCLRLLASKNRNPGRNSATSPRSDGVDYVSPLNGATHTAEYLFSQASTTSDKR